MTVTSLLLHLSPRFLLDPREKLIERHLALCTSIAGKDLLCDVRLGVLTRFTRRRIFFHRIPPREFEPQKCNRDAVNL